MKEIEAFGYVEPWLGRGAQPDAEQYRWLREQGFMIVANLRQHDEAQDIERSAPQLLGIQIPVKDHHAPTEDQALKWLRFCSALQERAKIYVHCRQGHGRTSVFCALVRLAQGTGLESAIEEERGYGFKVDEERDQVAFLHQIEARVQSGNLSLPPVSRAVRS